MLPPSIQVCPVELPGRGRRGGEPFHRDMTALAMQLAAGLPLQVLLLALFLVQPRKTLTTLILASP